MMIEAGPKITSSLLIPPAVDWAGFERADRQLLSLPATQMAAVLTQQVLHDYPDRETAEAVKFDVRWKAAIGASLDDPGFDPSSLVYWRKRLAGPPGGGFHDLGRCGGDPGHVTQLISVIRRVAREVPGAAGQIAQACTGHDYSVPGKPEIGSPARSPKTG